MCRFDYPIYADPSAFLDIPSYLLGEVQNSIVDVAGREDNRAELLSVFNMGVNVTEIFICLAHHYW